uniref:Uncharacterized protein n=1 Tax=Arcella intermedia TaxID=1963864 RepID=A0A6B2KX20_9EUKA
MCRPRLTCTGPNNCVYSDKSCGGTNCAKTQCDPATGNCVPINFCPKNPLVGGVPDLCRTLQNCYAVGNCSYVPAVTCTPPTACQTSTCQPATGTCLVANITSWDPVASCPAVSCQNPVKDPSAKTCCGYVPKCPPSSDYCVNATCVNNECVTNPRTCPPSAPGTPCTVNTGCSGGTCTYTAKTCPPSVDPCQTNVCNYQGNCVLQANNNPGCIDYCVGKVCPDVNCTQYTCNSATGACVDSTFPSTSCVLPNSCFIPTCNTTTSQCNLEAITVETCIKNYGAAPICQYWGLTPFRDSCCQLLPLCNTQLDPEHLCSLLYCDNTTNGKCLLKDNSAALCKPFLNDDLCRPLRTCDNSTGACLYDNLATNCEAIKPLACQDASCDPATGQCIFVNTSACKPVSKCFNVTCQKDECVIYTCDESDGKCYLNATTVCTAPNTCTHASCDPLLGCQYTPVDVNIECGVLADPCKVWVKNFTDPRCCGTTVRCAPSGDLCAPTICNATGKSCVNLTFTDICPAFDNSSGKPNKCRPLTGCALGGCIYQDLTCDKISNCMIPTCDPDTGLCSYTDSCPTNPCVSKRCNLVSGLCEVSSSLDCYLDSCTNTTCNPVLGGCQTLKVLGLSDCPTPTNSCMVNTLNAKNPTCCGETPKCVNNDPCFNVACVNGTCVTSSVCNSSTCATVSCSVVNGRPVCSQKAIPCVPQNPCFTVNTCVEGKPFTCTQTPLDCVKSNNKCIKYSCDPTAKSAATACTATPIICDDKNPCTNNTCNTTTGLCSYPNACVSSNLCLIPSCNATKGCVFTKKVCNDYDSCTDDECDVKTGKCEFKKKNCDDKNPCTVDTCSANLGCVNSPLDCTNVTRKNATSIQCGFWACNKSGAGCYPVVKVCNTILLTNTVIGVVAGTSAGVIVGIVVAIVAALGCAGGTTYAAYQRVEFSEDAPIYRNPLYEDPTKAGNNALYKPASG